jgi:hypothetical protein
MSNSTELATIMPRSTRKRANQPTPYQHQTRARLSKASLPVAEDASPSLPIIEVTSKPTSAESIPAFATEIQAQLLALSNKVDGLVEQTKAQGEGLAHLTQRVDRIEVVRDSNKVDEWLGGLRGVELDSILSRRNDPSRNVSPCATALDTIYESEGSGSTKRRRVHLGQQGSCQESELFRPHSTAPTICGDYQINNCRRAHCPRAHACFKCAAPHSVMDCPIFNTTPRSGRLSWFLAAIGL